METEVGDCIAGWSGTHGIWRAEKGGDEQSRVTLYFASARWLRETPGIGGEERGGGEYGWRESRMGRRGAIYMGPGGRYRYARAGRSGATADLLDRTIVQFRELQVRPVESVRWAQNMGRMGGGGAGE